jgi:predicted Ser/Thr protein kinase
MAKDAGDARDALRDRLQEAVGRRYRILRLLGRGGMGAVYLAREEALERLVALKVLDSGREQEEASRERFRREARTAAGLSHPNVVPLHDFGESRDGLLYLAMGYVHGETLAERLAREGRRPPAEVRRTVAEIADALHYAHRRGVVHRDVKPQNILLEDQTGRALLTDFGIARLADGTHLTQEGAVVGTPVYMAPEQCAGRPLDGRSDVYSLGVTAYLLLAGRPPFLGTAPELLVAHLNQEPPPLRDTVPDTPEDLAAAVSRALAKQPEHRWPDAAAFRDAVAPAGVDLDKLPEPLDLLDGAAAFLLPVVLAWALCAWEWALYGEAASPLVKSVALVVGGWLIFQEPLLLNATHLARQRGFRWGEIVHAVLRQPTWWPCFYYPRRFRRASDVWDGLPRALRVWRGGFTVALLCALGGGAALMAAGSPRVAALDFTEPAWTLALALLATGAGAALVALAGQAVIARRVLGMGLDVYSRRLVARVLLYGPTSNRLLWKRPEVTAFLRNAVAEPRTVLELAKAIEARGPATAAEEARNLLAAAEEAVRAEQQLAKARPLLASQPALAGRLDADLEAARARQEQCLDALRRLWQGAASDPGSLTTTNDNVTTTRDGAGLAG